MPFSKLTKQQRQRAWVFEHKLSNCLCLTVLTLDGAIKYARGGEHGEGDADRTSLPIILPVELKELTGSVRRKKAVVHV